MNMDMDEQPFPPFRWEDDLLANILQDPSYVSELIMHEPFAFSRHLHNKAAPGSEDMHSRQHQQQQQQRPQYPPPPRPPSSDFASPTTATLSAPSPFGVSSPSSVDDSGMHSGQEFPLPSPPPNVPLAVFARQAVPPTTHNQPTPSPSTPAPQGRKRTRAPEDVAGEPPAHRKMQHACTHCKRLKMKCTFQPGNAMCDRCIKKGHAECRVEGRRRNPGPNARELLLRDMKAKDQLIAGLLKHIFDPNMHTPLALATGRIDPASLTRTLIPPPSPPATASEDDDAPPHRHGAGRERSQDDQRAAQSASSLLNLITQAGAALRAPPVQWRVEEDSSDSSDSGSDDEGDSDDVPAAGKPVPSSGLDTLHSIPNEYTPHGLIASISLEDPVPTPLEDAIAKLEPNDSPVKLLEAVGKVDPSEPTDSKNPAMPKIPPAKVGLENSRYYHPGPGSNLPLREIIIERQMSIEILDHGVVTLDEVNKLFDIFYKTVNPALSILDERLHTPTATRKRCPFLFTVVCAAASRYYLQRPELYPILVHFAKKQAASSLIDGWKSVELCQAYIILGDYAPSARRWEEDRSYLYKGLAIRIAMDLNLHQPSRQKPRDEMHAREILNCTRTWLICYNLDRSGSTQFGKCATLPSEDLVVRASKEWYLESPYNHPYDVHLCAYVQLLRLMTQFHDIVQDKAAMKLNKNIDYLAVTRIYDDQLTAFKEEWTERFAQKSDPNDPAAVFRVHLMPVIVNYCKLVMYSFGFQHAFEKGLTRGDPFFLRCWNAATSVVRGMAEVLGPTGFLKYTAECHFVFGTFASGFLFKLLRPEFAAMVDQDQKDSILKLVTKLADVFERNAIDETHAPRLYARFLYGLVRKHSGGADAPAPAPAPGSSVPQEQQSQSSSSSSITPPASSRQGGSAKQAPARGASGGKSGQTQASSSSSAKSARPGASTAQRQQQQQQQPRSSMPPPPPPSHTHYQHTGPAPTGPAPGSSQTWHSGDVQMSMTGGYTDYSTMYPTSAGQGLPPQEYYDALSAQQQQQQWGMGMPMAGHEQFYTGAQQTMDLEESLLLPIRAITNPAWNEHMLLPGWIPHESPSSSSSTDGNTSGHAQAFPQTDIDSSAPSSFYAAAQGGNNAFGNNMW